MGIHSVSESLLEHMDDQNPDDDQRAPFGFAAYTSLARSEREQQAQQQPEQPESEDPHEDVATSDG